MQIHKRWQKFTLLNIGLGLGLFVSLFVIPARTSVWLLVGLFITIIVTMNYLLFVKLRKIENGETTKDTRFSTVIIYAGFFIFVLDLVFRLVHH